MPSRRSRLLALTLVSGVLGAPSARSAEPAEDAPAPLSSLGTDELPPSADIDAAFERYGLTRRSQGKRGTCSVFVVTGALEFALAKKTGKGARLSVEFLNWASNAASRTREDGSFFSDLWNGFARFGISPEADCPYQPAYDPELRPSAEARARARDVRALGFRFHWIKEWDRTKGITRDQLAAIKDTLSRGWPVCGGFLWPKEAVWDDDVLRICPRDQVMDGHSVLLVGYRDDPGAPGGGVVRVRNTSGGARDGYLTYEYLLTYMNDACWIAGEPPTEGRGAPAAFRGPLGALLSPPSGRNRRISSNEQPRWRDGNDDMKPLLPLETLELPAIRGPGVITHIWLTSHAGGANELDALSLRIAWDDREEPGVEVPLGDFFAVGQGKPAPVESFPVQVSPTGALTSYWRMPFRESARISIRNDNPDRSTGLYWQVDWVELDALPADVPYFHARFRREHPAVPGRDYLVADLEGSGTYVGTVFSVTLAQDGWFGEGDDFFKIDGEAVPSLQGTGTEDYFNDAWGFRPRTSLWFGQPRWQGDRAGDGGVCYRWHILDPVSFTKSLELRLEHKGSHEESYAGHYFERPDFLSSVAFWYQTGEPKRWEPLPAWNERRVPWEVRHLVRAFLKARASGAAKPAVTTRGLFGSRPVLSWPNEEAGARLTLPFSVSEDGRWAVRLGAVAAPGQGVHDIEIDGEVVLAAASFAAAEAGELDLLLGTHALSRGDHTLSFRALGAGGGAAGPLAVELLRLLKLPPEATSAVKGENEAHFIRLGIGRALYAYRLAWGDLPDSLEMLVQAGLLEERYLRDERDVPLRARRDGEHFVVESQGEPAWTHRWQGLDARR